MTRPSPNPRYAPKSSKAGLWRRLTSADLRPAHRSWAPEVWGTQVDHPSSPVCRTGTDHKCPIGCPQILGSHACTPRAAPPDLGDLVAPSHARKGRRSWCLWQPSPEGLLRSSCATRHQSLCPNAGPTARPCHVGPHRLAALPQKMTPQTPWKMSPPWGWAGATSATLVGSSSHDQT